MRMGTTSKIQPSAAFNVRAPCVRHFALPLYSSFLSSVIRVSGPTIT
jgi:hypothetical protein